MARNMGAGGGALHAESLSFALSRLIPRPEAQAEMKRLAREARAIGTALPDLVRRDFPQIDWSGPDLGQAPPDALAFVEAPGS